MLLKCLTEEITTISNINTRWLFLGKSPSRRTASDKRPEAASLPSDDSRGFGNGIWLATEGRAPLQHTGYCHNGRAKPQRPSHSQISALVIPPRTEEARLRTWFSLGPAVTSAARLSLAQPPGLRAGR